MAATTGMTGLLAATGSASTKKLIDAVSWYSVNPNIVSAELDTTGFASGLVFARFVPDLYSWTVSASGRFPATPQAAYRASISQSGSELYLSNVYGFSLDFSVAVGETTDLTATAAKTFAPAGPLVGRFTINARVDGTTALKVPNLSAANPGDDLTFTIGTETTNNDIIQVDGTNGGARILGISPTIAIGSTNDVTITGIFSGDIEIDGDASIFAVSAAGTPENMPYPAVDTITATAASGRTYSGSAFWQQFSVTANLGAAIEVAATFQGTGACTIA